MLGIFVSGCFFAIYRLSLFSCQGTLPLQRRCEILLILNHRSFVYRCCRFSSASTSGGIRSTSLWMFCNLLSSFARSMRSFILPLSLAFALASNFWFSSKRSFIVTLCTFSVGRRSSPFVGTTFSAWQELPLSSSQRWSDWYRPAWLQWPSPIWRGWPPAWIAGWGYFSKGKYLRR